ncbi:MAG TPA: hypothetical protein VGE94_18370, partial [Chloroflexota bacterium]
MSMNRERVRAAIPAAAAPAARTNRKVVVATILVVAVAATAWLLFHRSPTVQTVAGASPAPSALVKTAPLQRLNLSDDLTAFGQVTTGLDVAISFPRAGQISRLLVIAGQRVQRGTPLVTLTSDPSARLAYTQALNAVDFAQGELRRTQELFS